MFCQAVWWNEREAKSQKYKQESNQDCSVVFKLWRASQGEELKKKSDSINALGVPVQSARDKRTVIK